MSSLLTEGAYEAPHQRRDFNQPPRARAYKKKYAAGADEALTIIRNSLEWRSRVGVAMSAALGLIGIIVIGSASAIWKRVIDAQLEARSMLEKTEANLFTALGLAEAVVWEADLQTWAFSSPSDMSVFRGPGSGPGDRSADFWERFLHPSDIGRVQVIWSKHLGAGAPLDMELPVRLSSVRS